MQIPRGFEMMAQSIIKMMGLDPNRVMGAIDGMHGALQNVATDLRTIRDDQKRIMAFLGLPEEQNNGRIAGTTAGHEHETGTGGAGADAGAGTQ